MDPKEELTLKSEEALSEEKGEGNDFVPNLERSDRKQGRAIDKKRLNLFQEGFKQRILSSL